MLPDGSVTTATSTNNQNISYGASIHHGIVGARSSGTSGGVTDFYDGRISEISVWAATLTQAQIFAAALDGPYRCGVKPTCYAPVWGVASLEPSPEPELAIGGASGTLSGAPPGFNHAPVGCPFPVAA